MTKIVINGCYGGFGLSRKATLRIRELKADPNFGGPCIIGDVYVSSEIDAVPKPVTTDYGLGSGNGLYRDDPILVKVVEELGEEASGGYAQLKIVEVPNDVTWHIEEYDGIEWVAEDHRTWQ